ncbi:MAG: hypothetical protein K2J01_06655 [Clostridiales bacterium]|nr:hypothetical protein [Clostridiales bacterium]
MKRKIITILLSIFTSMIVLIGCQKNDNNDNNDNDQPLYCQNEILPKIDCITKIKKLLDCTNVYFFDCDFSEFEDITITDVSYNISISGYLIKNRSNTEVLDLNESADIKFVTNYKIMTNSNCFGFSIISSVMQPKVYRTDLSGNTTKTPSQIYDKFTFTSIDNISIDQITTFSYTNNSITQPIKVPNNFYPYDLIPNAASQIKIFNGHTMYDEPPIKIITHYKNESEKPDDETFIKSLAYYFKKNGKYIEH